MIASIVIENLRGIASGTLEGLTPLTILVGPNGSGKSTLLDALLLGATTTPKEHLQLVLSRHAGAFQPERWLFRQRPNRGLGFGLTLRYSSGPVRTMGYWLDGSLRLRYSQPGTTESEGPLGTISISEVPGEPAPMLIDHRDERLQQPLTSLFSRAVEAGKRTEINEVVRALLPGLSHLEILTEKENEKPVLHTVFRDRSVPVELAGDGIKALLRTALELAVGTGLVLIEEPEVHLHPAAIRQTAQAILGAVRRGTQVVLTTHSIELIDAFLLAMENPNDLVKLSVFLVKLEDGMLCTARLPGENVAVERHQIGADLR